MPSRTHPDPTPATVTVDVAQLVGVLYALAQLPPSSFSPAIAHAAIELEAACVEFVPPHGLFDLGWGMRAGSHLP